MTQSGEGTPDKPWIIKTIFLGSQTAGKNTVLSKLTPKITPTYLPANQAIDLIGYKLWEMPEKNCKNNIWLPPLTTGPCPRNHFRFSHISISVVRTSLPDQHTRLRQDLAAFEESKDNPYREYILVSNVDKTKPRQLTTEEANRKSTPLNSNH